jgi:two-component system chemotaxis response regulator CheB
MSGIELVVIGGSAGSIDALRPLLGDLPADFASAVAIVIHLPSDGRSLLPEIFSRPDGPRMKFAEDKETIERGTIYFATPDYHLLVETGGTFALSQIDRVHFSRPAIDVLFETAAEAYGERLMGIILSGANADGAAGLKAVVDAGGRGAVQSLECSEMIAMPAAALQTASGSAELSLTSLAQFLRTLGDVDVR